VRLLGQRGKEAKRPAQLTDAIPGGNHNSDARPAIRRMLDGSRGTVAQPRGFPAWHGDALPAAPPGKHGLN
jgi:hypothetical protein